MIRTLAIAAMVAAGAWVRDGVRQTPRATGWVRDGLREVRAVAAEPELPHYDLPDVPGLVLWLDADDGPGLTLGAGGAVSVWPNKADTGGNDRLVPADAANAPVWARQGWRGWVRWTDASRPLVQGGAEPWGATVAYLFVALCPELPQASNPYANMAVACGAGDYSFRLIDFQDRAPPSFTLAWNYGDFGYSGYGGFVHRDGAAVPDQSTLAVAGPLVMSFHLGSGAVGEYQLSSDFAGRFFTGRIGEVVGYSSLPGEADANAVLAYLGAKWGVAVTEMEFPEAPSTAQVTVYFDGQGGSVPEGEGSKLVTVGETYGTLPGASYDGYMFGGWYSYDMGGYADEYTSVMLDYDHTLYAVWY